MRHKKDILNDSDVLRDYVGCIPCDPLVVSDMINEAEDKLLSAVSSNHFHVLAMLHRLFPPITERKYSFRPRKHDIDLLLKDNKNYILGLPYSIGNSRNVLA